MTRRLFQYSAMMQNTSHVAVRHIRVDAAFFHHLEVVHREKAAVGAHLSRLLWEEGVKTPATAMGTGSFRHGPQEMVRSGMRFGMWIDGARMREQDLAVARDLGKLGASVMLIGQKIPGDAGDLVFEVPAIPAEWQFLIDMIPAQLAAERLAQLSGVDCDTFRLCSSIVEDESGLLRGERGKA